MSAIPSRSENSRLSLFVFVTLLIVVTVASVVIVILDKSIASEARWVSLEFHSSLEAANALTALILAIVIVLPSDRNRVSDHFIWISCGFCFMGVLGFMHASIPIDDAFVWLRTVANLTGGLVCCGSWLPDRFITTRLAKYLPVSAAALALLIGIVTLNYAALLPTMSNEGSFTSQANAANLAAGLLFLLAAAGLFRQYLLAKNTDDLVITALCLLFGVAGTLFIIDGLWSISWWYWHALTLIASTVAIGHTYFASRRTGHALKIATAFAFLQDSYHSLLENSVDAFVVVAPDNSLRYMNPAAETLLGDSSTRIIGPTSDFPIEQADVREITFADPDGEPIIAEMRVAKTTWLSEPAFLATLHDITELALLRENLRDQSLKDELTGLYNRRGFLP
ncbi:MAG: PAS domain-containing protein [Dehalococcoidia bacterium]|nr:PAS domain-containing protein [Dehalococcoidia bacterium]